MTDLSTASFNCAYPDAGTFTARGRIQDKDGGFMDYTVSVTVLTPHQAVDALIDEVQALVNSGVLSNGQANPLLNELEQAIHKIDQGKPDQAIQKLEKFIEDVNDLMAAGDLTPAQGQPLIDGANEIIAALSN